MAIGAGAAIGGMIAVSAISQLLNAIWRSSDTRFQADLMKKQAEKTRESATLRQKKQETAQKRAKRSLREEREENLEKTQDIQSSRGQMAAIAPFLSLLMQQVQSGGVPLSAWGQMAPEQAPEAGAAQAMMPSAQPGMDEMALGEQPNSELDQLLQQVGGGMGFRNPWLELDRISESTMPLA